MTYLLPILMLLLGIAIGAAAAWLVMRLRIEQAAERARGAIETERATLVERLDGREEMIAKLQEAIAQSGRDASDFQQKVTQLAQERAQLATLLQKEREHAAEKLALFNQAEQKLTDAFKALSADALKSNNQSFLELAKTSLEKLQEAAKGDLDKRQLAIGALVQPVKESLEKVSVNIKELESARANAYGGLSQRLESMLETENKLRTETASLVKALRAPNVRGRWGEMQLKRVVELAGMLDHCDFHEQVSETTEEGRLRPDLVVHLPGGVEIVVDAKVPLAAYLEALEATDDAIRQQKLKDHARQVQERVVELSSKAYWQQFQPGPDFVILFLPGETFYDAAREQDPSIIEAAVNCRVMIATPMSLITLLRTIHVGWRQERLAREAETIGALGKNLYHRLTTLGEHLLKLGRTLKNSVEAYNDAIGAIEQNVLSAARKFRDLGAIQSDKEIPELAPLENMARMIQKEELLPSGAAARLAAEEGAATAKQARFLETDDL
ncbi:MAG TPA: DNA recombination protein RmuC [Pirellulales bacterium]|nr:DNA recombination protein RmuC [Pirellulales bacterium]